MDDHDAEFDMMDEIDWSAVDLPQQDSATTAISARTVTANSNHRNIQNSGDKDNNHANELVAAKSNLGGVPESRSLETHGAQMPSSSTNHQKNIYAQTLRTPEVVDLTDFVETDNHHLQSNNRSTDSNSGIHTHARLQGHNNSINGNGNNHSENENIESAKLKEEIEKLKELLSIKDEQVFNLESTIATIEAETAHALKSNRMKLGEQIQAKDDQLRMFEKEVGMKNMTILKLRKRARSSMNNPTGANENDNGEMVDVDDSTQLQNIDVPMTIATTAATVRMDDTLPASTNPANHGTIPAPTTVVETEEAPKPSSATNSMPNLSTTEEPPFSSVQHEKTQLNIARIRQSKLLAGRQEEMIHLLTHLIRCCESSPLSVLPSPSPRKHFPDACDSSSINDHESTLVGKKTNNRKRPRAQNSESSHWGGFRRSWLTNASNSLKPWGVGKKENDSDSMLKHQSIIIRDMLIQLLEQYSSLNNFEDTTNGTSLESVNKLERMLDLPDVDHIAKELVVIISSIAGTHDVETGDEEDIQDFHLGSRRASMVVLSVLVELCFMSEKARKCVRLWLSSFQNGSIVTERIGSKKQGTLNRVRGVPQKYQNCVKRIQEYDCVVDNSQRWNSEDNTTAIKSFQESIMSWIVIGCYTRENIDQQSPDSGRDEAQYLQRTSLELLRLLTLDAPSCETVPLLKSIVSYQKSDIKLQNKRDIIFILEQSSISELCHIGRRHHLLVNGNDDKSYSNLFGVVDSKTPDKTMLDIKTRIVQLFHRFTQCPDGNQTLLDLNIMRNPHFRDNVSYGRRIVASVLDDIQCVIIPSLAKTVSLPKEVLTDLLIYGSTISQFLAVLSISEGGYELMKTEMKVGGAATARLDDNEFSTSGIGVISDYLEHCTLLLLSESDSPSNNRSKEFYTIHETVESAVFFLHTILNTSHQLGSVRGDERDVSFYSILVDIERIHPVLWTLKIILRCEEIDELTRCRVRTMLQNLD